MKKLLIIAALLAALAAGWLAGRRSHNATSASGASEATSGARRVRFYQSPMHPWIRSDKPGRCTICGMELAPVYEGESGVPVSADLVTLGTNSLRVVDVQTAPAVRHPLVRTLRGAGTLQEDTTRQRVLSAYVEGRLDTLFVNADGAEVAAGEPLALVYSPVLLGAIREYLSLVRDLGPDAPLARSAAMRLVQFGLSDPQIARLPQHFTATNLHVELPAPMSGTVVRRRVVAGQTVTQGQELFELADYSTLWFELIVYEQDLPWIQPGQTVEVTFPSVPGRVFTNAIAFIQPSLDEATRSTRARVPLENPLVAGAEPRRRLLQRLLYGTATVRTESPEVLAIPRSAVLDPGSRPVVFVELASGHYAQRAVRLGRRGDTEVEVLEGLAPGDRVVTQGALLLDAQAQLNAVALGTPFTPAASSAAQHEPLTAAQQGAAMAAVTAADSLARALASDDLAAFNTAAPAMHRDAEALGSALASTPGWQSLAEPLGRAGHLDVAADLASARRQFQALMAALVPLAQQVRSSEPALQSLKIYRCPMTQRSFPGAPPRAEWLQLSGPLRNPYFGSEMPDCGSEVTP
ncbi:MAG: efflux RND transporter periplasmic adaptor subunit [Verrucomicrobia bacterium]|nr:efflux RND transporter periplasmic adaptor subunit [Verrucomicrobiota bacterium]